MDPKGNGFFQSSKEEEKEPVVDFKCKEMEEKLKNLQTKRVQLNQAVQVANSERIFYRIWMLNLNEW